jgi:uncharacterized protein YndB with AHSA1/START domain
MIIVYVLLGLLALVLIRAATLGKEARIEKEIQINCPVEDVFSYVLKLRHHREFNKWTMTDPNVAINYTGEDGTVGFSSKWNSEVKNVGEGEQIITSITPLSRIDYDLIFVKPFAGVAKSYIITRATPSGTLVKWGFHNERNAMAKVMQTLLNLEKMLGRDLEISLLNLKQLLEKKK